MHGDRIVKTRRVWNSTEHSTTLKWRLFAPSCSGVHVSEPDPSGGRPLVAAIQSWLTIIATGIVLFGFAGTVHAQGVEAADPADESDSEQPDREVWLGVQIGDADDADSGAPVERVLEDSPAARADIATGDQIDAVAGTSVDGLSALRRALSEFDPGDEVEVTITRAGERSTRRVVVSARPSRRELLREQVIGVSLPDFRLEPIEGDAGARGPEDFRGKPVVLEFWATWCYPCRFTAAMLNELEETFGDDVHIVGVSREDRATLEEYAADHDHAYELARDSGEKAHDRLLVTSYPTIVVADAEGDVVEVYFGRDVGDELRKKLEELLN